MGRINKKFFTGNYPLKLVEQINSIVNKEFEEGTYYDKVSDITKSLLTYWFDDEFCDERGINFHKGQKQAILNTIYCYEVLQDKNVCDLYNKVSEIVGYDFINNADFFDNIRKKEFDYNKYCIKMATGTGKTFVMNALLIWQYLNYFYKSNNVKFKNNFLFIAPNNIVYERLFDAFLGKNKDGDGRDFSTSDIKKNEDLFVPKEYRNVLYSFIRNSVLNKDEIGKKTVGDGVIAISNWQFLNKFEEECVENEEKNNEQSVNDMINDICPIQPNKNKGADLNVLDSKYNNNINNFLSNIKDLCIFNDEAHHIHNDNKDNIMIWQKIINKVLENTNELLQIDFTATPYYNTNLDPEKDEKEIKNYFPHIITDFPLIEAIKNKIVKIPAMDLRDESDSIKSENLDFKSIKDDDGKVILSEGQRLMLNAGFTKLEKLEQNFIEITRDYGKIKYPKMLVICEDTSVSPCVVEFFKDKGLSDDDILRIDSGKKGEISDDEWEKLKLRLNGIDNNKSPKIIVSVLMLREGFDINNICVIVPLRKSSSSILIEQIIGRGLRLMWREPEFNEYKDENLQNILDNKRITNYFDILSIIEHPNYKKYYESLRECIANEDNYPIVNNECIIGDIINVSLKENYEKYDLYWPVIIYLDDEETKIYNIDYKKIEPFREFSLEYLLKKVDKQEIFTTEEIIKKGNIDKYKVNSDLIPATCYNEYLKNFVEKALLIKTSNKYPILQINKYILISSIDNYIKKIMFGKEFDPTIDSNWKILEDSFVVDHLRKVFNEAILEIISKMEYEPNIEVEKRYFSELKEIRIRKNYSLNVRKCIYNKIGYPSNKGGFEHDFIVACESDYEVEAFIKIKERAFDFIKLTYINSRGFRSKYYPDFIVKTKDSIFIVETKGDDKVENEDTRRKAGVALDFVDAINKMNDENRDFRKWYYVLLSDRTFYNNQKSNATVSKILEMNVLNKNFFKKQFELF